MSGSGIEVSNPDGVPTISGNTVNETGGSGPIYVANAGIDLATLGGNSGTGNAINGLVLAGDSVAADSTLPWPGAFPPVVSSTLTIPEAISLTMNAGAVLQGLPSSHVVVSGTLNTNGTAENPAILTSWRDVESTSAFAARVADSQDASRSSARLVGAVVPQADLGQQTPLAGDWGGLVVQEGATANLQGVKLQYSEIAVNVTGESQTTIRGSVLNSNIGVQSEYFVDARYTDWGSSTGPAPYGSGTPIQGSGAIFFNYVGSTLPVLSGSDPDPATYEPEPVGRCKRVMFLGVRGSGEWPKGRSDDAAYSDSFVDSDGNAVTSGNRTNAESENDWENGMGRRIDKVWESFDQALSGYRPNIPKEVLRKGIALRYQAEPVPAGDWRKVFVDGAVETSEFFDSIDQGVQRIKQYLNDEIRECGDQNTFSLVTRRVHSQSISTSRRRPPRQR